MAGYCERRMETGATLVVFAAAFAMAEVHHQNARGDQKQRGLNPHIH
jgi:hypothetical protein